MMASSNPFRRIDWILMVPMMCLMAIGTLFIFSSGVSSRGIVVSNEYLKQIIWISLGLIILVVFSLLRYELYRDLAIPIFVALAALVVLTSFVGKTVNGAKNWLGIGDFGVQPSEFLKIGTVVTFSLFVERWAGQIKSFKYFLLISLLMLVPIGIVLVQQDLGTSLVFLPMYFFIMITAGAAMKHIMYLLMTGGFLVLFVFVPSWDKFLSKGHVPLMAVFNDNYVSLLVFGTIGLIAVLGIIGFFVYRKHYFHAIAYVASSITISFLISLVARMVLKEYQVKRLLVFLDPYFDSKGSGWNIIQSLTAVGSGGFSGKGYLQGTQSHLQFLPEQSTDFIFSIISEEWGFLGGIAIFTCFLVILIRMMWISSKAKDLYGACITAGIAGMLFFHLLVNVGMAIGVMPVTGIPLPMVSYGGSALWAMLWAFGITMSINSNRFQF
jgi:rod shape determining protein RodA